MSGHRVRRDPFYKEKPWRWGPAGWYCCGTRLMAAGTLAGDSPVHRCLHCGVVIAVAGDAIVDLQRPRQVEAAHQAIEQPTFDLGM
jgi:hypothetical protein